MTSSTPDRPRFLREVRDARHNLSSLLPTSRPKIFSAAVLGDAGGGHHGLEEDLPAGALAQVHTADAADGALTSWRHAGP